MLQGDIIVKQLDLADLQSIRRFSKAFKAEEKGPDLLILNAGVMACPLSYTKDGFEMQIGVFQPLVCHLSEGCESTVAIMEGVH